MLDACARKRKPAMASNTGHGLSTNEENKGRIGFVRPKTRAEEELSPSAGPGAPVSRKEKMFTHLAPFRNPPDVTACYTKPERLFGCNSRPSPIEGQPHRNSRTGLRSEPNLIRRLQQRKKALRIQILPPAGLVLRNVTRNRKKQAQVSNSPATSRLPKQAPNSRPNYEANPILPLFSTKGKNAKPNSTAPPQSAAGRTTGPTGAPKPSYALRHNATRCNLVQPKSSSWRA